jgi:hypothetical protein
MQETSAHKCIIGDTRRSGWEVGLLAGVWYWCSCWPTYPSNGVLLFMTAFSPARSVLLSASASLSWRCCFPKFSKKGVLLSMIALPPARSVLLSASTLLSWRSAFPSFHMVSVRVTVNHRTGEVTTEFKQNFVDIFLEIAIPARDFVFNIIYDLFDTVKKPDEL